MMRVEEPPDAAHDFNLACFRHRGEAAGQFADHLFLPATQLGEIDLRLPKRKP